MGLSVKLVSVAVMSASIVATFASGASSPGVAAFECEDWRLVHPLSVSENLNGVAYADDHYVAVGDNGTIIISPSYVGWRTVDSPTNQDLNSIVVVDDVIWAAGENGTLVTGRIDTEWSIVPLPTTSTINDISIDERGILVAVGDSGEIVSSVDGGQTWFAPDSGVEANLSSVAWTGRAFLAVGEDGMMLSSPDGGRWEVVPPITLYDIQAVASNRESTVLVSSAITYRDAGDGNWSLVDATYLKHDKLYQNTDVAWTGDRYVTPGAYSADGLTWHLSGAEPSGRPGAVGPEWFGDGAPPPLVGVGEGGSVYVSLDNAEHWRSIEHAKGADVNGLATNGNVTVAVGGSTVLISSDLVRWDAVNAGYLDVQDFKDVASDGQGFIAGGSSPSGRPGLFGSADGVYWQALPQVCFCDVYSVDWDGTRWIAGECNAISVSEDGTTWRRLVLPCSGSGGWDDWMDAVVFSGVASNGSVIVGVDLMGGVGVSEDGYNLRMLDLDFPVPGLLHDVAWGGGRFVAVGSIGVVMTSDDGLSWALVEDAGVPGPLKSIHWDGEGFFAVGEDGLVVVSEDGHSWRQVTPGIEADYLDAVITPSGAVLGASDGTLVRVDCESAESPLEARLTWRPTVPEAGTDVAFYDMSSGSPDSVHWRFDDGTTNASPVAVHRFLEPGTHRVELQVSNGQDTSRTEAQVHVRNMCRAPEAVHLTAEQGVLPDGSGVGVRVHWDSVQDLGVGGHYIISDSRTPGFEGAGGRTYDPGHTESWFRYYWGSHGLLYYRAIAYRECPDGLYASVPAPPLRVDIEPSFEFPGDAVWHIPAVASGEGLHHTHWDTEIILNNPSAVAAPVYLGFLPRGAPGGAVLGQKRLLEAGETTRVKGALNGFGEDPSGALMVVSDRPLHVGARIFNDAESGEFGQFVVGVDRDRILQAGHRSVLVHLRENQGFRTNLALANPSTGDAVARVDLVAADGAALGSAEYSVPAMSSRLVDRVAWKITGGTVDLATAVVSTPQASRGGIVAMASMVDNRSGDPTTIPALREGRLHRSVVLPTPQLPEWGHGAANRWTGMVFGVDRWVVADRYGVLASQDGLNWDLVYDPPEKHADLVGVAFNGREYLAVGDSTIVWSPNGLDWAAEEWPHGELYGVTWDGQRWFAVGKDGYDHYIATSTDGEAWEIREGPPLNSVAWSGGRYVGTTWGGVAVSADGVSWDLVELEGGGYHKALCRDGGGCVAIEDSRVATSDDGVEWKTQRLSRKLGDLVSVGDLWVIGSTDRFYVSLDGTTWDPVFPSESWQYPLEKTSAMASSGDTVVAIKEDGGIVALGLDTGVLTIPAVAHQRGANESIWRSEVNLHNAGDADARCSLEFLERSRDNSSPESVSLDLAPLATIVFVDALQELFDRSGAGALRIRSDARGVMAGSRTSTEAGVGTYGQSVPALRTSDAIRSFESGRVFGLAHSPDRSDGYRTNIGLVSGCDRPMSVVVDLSRGANVPLSTFVVELAPFGVHQHNDVFRGSNEPAFDDGSAVIATQTVGCSFYAYASVINNRSNDPVFVPALP
jgi:PKD repeat protein